MKLFIVALLACVALSAAAIPQISTSYTVTETDSIDIHQGDWKMIDGSTCCNTKGGCKVQSEVQAGKNYVDAANNRTRFEPFGSPNSIVTLYNIGKEMLVSNGTCQSYCPLQGDEFEPLEIDPSAKKVGTKVVNGVTCTGYEWKVTIGGVVVMETITMYVDDSVSPAIPCSQTQILTPFGGAAIGTEDSLYQQFVGGVPAASLFDVKGIDQCAQGKNCNNNSNAVRRLGVRQLLKN